MEPKFKAGDTVRHKGATSTNWTILESYEQVDLTAGTMAFYYTLESTYCTLRNIEEDLIELAPKSNGCECGSHAVVGYENAHSFWCPKYRS